MEGCQQDGGVRQQDGHRGGWLLQGALPGGLPGGSSDGGERQGHGVDG